MIAFARAAPPADRAFAAALASAPIVKIAVDAGATPWSWLVPVVALGAAAWLRYRTNAAPAGCVDAGRLVLVLLGLWYLSGIGPRVGGDGVEYYVAARSLLFDGDVDVRNDFACVGHPAVITIDGEVKARFPVGLSLLWIPSLAATHVGVALSRLLGSGLAANGCSTPYVSAALCTSFAFGFGGLLVLEALLRRFYSRSVAFLAVAAVWLATPLFFYMFRAPSMSHATASALFTAMVALTLRAASAEGPRPSLWTAVGACAGLLALVRPNDLLHLGVPLLVIALRVADKRGAILRLAIGPAIAVVIQAVWWLAVFGTDFVSKVRRIGRVASGSPEVLDVLFSARHGLFTWTPLYLLAPLGWLLWWRRDRVWAAACAFGFAVLLLQTSTTGDWWGADSFGQRRMLTVTALFAFGIAETLRRMLERPVIPLAGALLLLAVWNQQFGYVYDSQWLGPRDQPIALAGLTRAQLELAHRGLLRAARWMPRRLWALANDNLTGVWIDDGVSPLRGRIQAGRDYEELPPLFTEGWAEPARDDTGPLRHTLGRRCVLTVPIRAPRDLRFAMYLRPARHPVRVDVSVNEAAVATWRPQPSWATVETVLPAALLETGLNRIELRFEDEAGAAPLPSEGAARVPRRAWAAVRWMQFDRVP